MGFGILAGGAGPRLRRFAHAAPATFLSLALPPDRLDPGLSLDRVPINWGSLLGVIMLWGRFDHAGWQRRVSLLLVMSLVDVGLWFLDNGEALGIAEGNFGHDWLLEHVGEALGWAEFALLAGLSCDYLEHLGQEYARESGKATRSMAVTGAVLWLLMFCAADRLASRLAADPPPVPRHRGVPALPGLPAHLGHHALAGDGPRHRRGEAIEPGAGRDAARGRERRSLRDPWRHRPGEMDVYRT